MGLIQPSYNPMASPIVCVAKKDGGVRIACDYRYLNSFAVGDAFPMSTINETLVKIGSKNTSVFLMPNLIIGKFLWRNKIVQYA